MEFANPDELNRFVTEVRADLEAAGLHAAAARFAGIQGAVFTTGSEWLEYLGTAIEEIRSSHSVPGDIDAKLERISRHVRRHTW